MVSVIGDEQTALIKNSIYRWVDREGESENASVKDTPAIRQ